MINTSKESIDESGTLADPEKDNDLKKTKIDIENNITKLLKLVKNEDQQQQQEGKKNRNPKQVKKERELVGLIEDLNKHYHSLYALCDHLNSEYEKAVSRRRTKKGSVGSNSDSDSEYFSSEEIDIIKSPAQKHRSSTAIFKIDEVFMINELEELANSQKKEIEILSQQKKDLELQVEELSEKNRNIELQIESHAREFEELSAKNNGMNDRVSELELLLKQEKGAVSNLQAKVKNNETEAKSNNAKLMARIKNLDMEAKSLRSQKDNLEERIKGDKAEASTQRKELMERLHSVQQNLASMSNQNKELESQVEKEREMGTQYLTQIQNLSENLAEMNSVKLSMVEEKERFLGRIKDLELELEEQSNKRNALEEQLRGKSYDMKQVEDENKSLQDRNSELKRAMMERGEEINALLKEPESQENAASMQTMTLEAELNGLRLELDTLREQKSKLEIQNERSQKEYEENIEKLEKLNKKLTVQIGDNEKTIERVNEEHKQTKILFNKFKLNRQTAERKMEELADEYRRKMEDNIRLLHQRIHVTEQLNNENKNSFRILNQRYKDENKMLEEKIAGYEEELKISRASVAYEQNGIVMKALNDLELATSKGLDSMVGRLEERNKHVLSRVYKMKGEVQFAKDLVKKRNIEMKEMRENVEYLKALVNGKEEQEILLREKVWKLEAKVSKEGGEKLNLKNAVTQLEKKVARLENIVKDKDEDLLSLAEKKREAIRQLCFVVDFHRDRCKDLKDLVIKLAANNNNNTTRRKGH